MRQSHRLHQKPHAPPWVIGFMAWLVIGLVLALNLIMMWRIATATP